MISQILYTAYYVVKKYSRNNNQIAAQTFSDRQIRWMPSWTDELDRLKMHTSALQAQPLAAANYSLS